MSKWFDVFKHPRMLFIVEEHINLYAKLGVAIRFGSSSSISGSDEMLGYESLPLSRIRSIEDGASKLCHVACEKELLCDRVRSIRN